MPPHRSPAPEPVVSVAESNRGDSGGPGPQATSSRWTETAYCTDGDQDHSTEDQQGRFMPFDEGVSWPPTRCRVSPAASISTTRTLASLLRSDGAGMSCGRGLGVRRRPTRRTSSHPRRHGRAGPLRRVRRSPPGRWTPGGLCCGASCWKPRPGHASPRIVLPSRRPRHRAGVIGGSMGPERPRTTAN
jgi:hypothetical protein